MISDQSLLLSTIVLNDIYIMTCSMPQASSSTTVMEANGSAKEVIIYAYSDL